MKEQEILSRLRRLRAKDPFFGDGKILSSVSTKPLDVSLEAFKIFADTNALDTHIFSSVKILENEVIGWLGELLKNPNAYGYVTTGGTEANIYALWVAKENHPDKHEIVAPRSAHYSIEKAARMMNLDIRRVEVDDNFRAKPDSIRKSISEDTLAVVLTAGTSALGMVDPVEEITEFCDNVFVHVDAAFGGFIIPFLDRERVDFSLDNVDSITVDPHKMGMCPIPSGSILFRDNSLVDGIKFNPTYLPIETQTLVGTRSGGAIAATWATIMRLGFDGYKKIAGQCMQNTALLCDELGKNHIHTVVEPDLNIVGIKVANPREVVDSLNRKGWKVSAIREPRCVRVVVMPHVKTEHIKKFVSDLGRAI